MLGVATVLLVVVAAWQICAARRQAKGWQALAACEKYALDPILDRCCRRLEKAGAKGVKKHPERYALEVTTVLNYLDGLAVGIEQNLYVESIVWDHLGPILTAHVRAHLTGPGSWEYKIDSSAYLRLIALSDKWTDKRTRFRDGWALFPWRS